jgi:hypothetical protein
VIVDFEGKPMVTICDNDWSNYGDFIISDTECYMYLPYRTAMNWIQITLCIGQLILAFKLVWSWWPRDNSHLIGPSVGAAGATAGLWNRPHSRIAPSSNSNHTESALLPNNPLPSPLPTAGLVVAPIGGTTTPIAATTTPMATATAMPIAWAVHRLAPSSSHGTNSNITTNNTTTNDSELGTSSGTPILLPTLATATAIPSLVPTRSPTSAAESSTPPTTIVHVREQSPLTGNKAPTTTELKLPHGNSVRVIRPSSAPLRSPLPNGGSNAGIGGNGGVVRHSTVGTAITILNQTTPVPLQPHQSQQQSQAAGGARASIHGGYIGVVQLMAALICCHRRHTIVLAPAFRAALHTMGHGIFTIIMVSIRLSDIHRGIGITWTATICAIMATIIWFRQAARLSIDLIAVQVRWSSTDPILAAALQRIKYVIFFGFGLLSATQFILFALSAPYETTREWQHKIVASYMFLSGVCFTITTISLPYFSKRMSDRISLASTLTTLSASQQAERMRLASVLRTAVWRPIFPSVIMCLAFFVAAFVPWMRTRTMYLISKLLLTGFPSFITDQSM